MLVHIKIQVNEIQAFRGNSFMNDELALNINDAIGEEFCKGRNRKLSPT